MVMARQEIEATNARSIEAWGRGDAASVAALYTEDATVLPPNSQIVRGRKEVERFWKQMMQRGVRVVELRTLDVTQSGDFAYEVGAYALQIRPKRGRATTDKGKYVVVWKRQHDGSWQLAVDIWNTDSPLPAAEP